MRAYIINLLYALDLWVNALFAGKQHETLSARWGKMGKKVRLWYWACRMLNWFDIEHCERSAAKYEKIREGITNDTKN